MLKNRLLDKTVKSEDGCWVWVGAASKKPSGHNYGLISVSGKLQMAHRVSYELFREPLKPGMVLDHLCRNTLCVNPEHLEEVTPKQNINRGRRAASEKTHCPSGHEYSEANLYITSRGHRECRICRKEKAREYALKRAR